MTQAKQYLTNPSDAEATPSVTVGVRFHDITQIQLLERCLIGISGQVGVRPHVLLAVQGFSKRAEKKTDQLVQKMLAGSTATYDIINVPNPKKKDLRARLLNVVVDHHYDAKMSDYLIFIDFDDIWFQNALETLLEPLTLADFALSYASIHCADIYYDQGQFYTRDIRDVYGMATKVKRNLMQGNFLPLHSYLFHTGRIAREVLHYDEELARLEDYDVLLKVAREYPVSGLHRNRLIGLYNFYTLKKGYGNSTRNVFSTEPAPETNEKWAEAWRIVASRHAAKPWQDFWGEE